jgi:hypothetical protein
MNLKLDMHMLDAEVFFWQNASLRAKLFDDLPE